MDEARYLDELIAGKRPVMIRLTEGRDISAVPLSHDRAAIIIQRNDTGRTALIYKRAISVITPMGE